MKLRNKKTGEINKLLGAKMEMGIIWLNIQFQHRESKAYCYNSLAELNEEWEDYEPKEPLIKDEKIRKLVKEWATLFEEHRKIKYYEYNDFVVFRLCREKGTPDPELDISIDYELVNLREGYEYDFEELCGEEKECES